MIRVYHVPEKLYTRLHSRAYTTGRGAWEKIIAELRECEQPEDDFNILTNSEELSKIRAAAVTEGRLEGLKLALQTLRDLEAAQNPKGK